MAAELLLILLLFKAMICLVLSQYYDVASVSEITPCRKKIDVYRFLGNVMTNNNVEYIITKL